MIDFFHNYWPIVVSLASAAASFFSLCRSLIEVRRIRAQISLIRKQELVAEEQLRKLKAENAITPETVSRRSLVVPSERELRRLTKSFWVPLSSVLVLVALSLFLHSKLRQTETAYFGISDVRDAAEYKKALSVELSKLDSLAVRSEYLSSECLELGRIHDETAAAHYAAVEEQNQLSYRKQVLDHRVMYLTDALTVMRDELEEMQAADSVARSGIEDIAEATRDVETLNRQLEEMKAELEMGRIVDIVVDPIKSFVWLEGQPVRTFSILESARWVPESLLSILDTRQLRSRSLAAQVVTPEDKIVISERDNLSVVRAYVHLTEGFNSRLEKHLEDLSVEIDSIRARLAVATKRNAELDAEIEGLEQTRDELESETEIMKQDVDVAVQQYSETLEAYEESVGHFNNEYLRQVQLFAEIGELQLELQQKQ